MTTSSRMQKTEVGEARPSQIITTYGIGSLVDLPNMTVMVMGLDDWPAMHGAEIAEERLLRSAQAILGPQVGCFRTPPRGPDAPAAPLDDARLIGVPVAPFPRWLVCSSCHLLAPLSSNLFLPKVNPFRNDRTCYVHNCNKKGRPPIAIPARFMATCERGHLDDFPWVAFVHNGPTECKGSLYLYEVGASGEALDVEVKCAGCDTRRRMGQAFGLSGKSVMLPCQGRHPHLRGKDPNGCDQGPMKPILQGASNLWFPVLISALSVPQASDDLDHLVDDNWTVLEKAATLDVLKAFRAIGQLRDLSPYSDDRVWAAIQKKRENASTEADNPNDLKSPEWEVFSNPTQSTPSRTFQLRPVPPPAEFADCFDKIVLVEKLREVRALIGFTRLVSPRDFDSPSELPENKRVPLSRKKPSWLPASETRGEGIFFQFAEQRIQQWVAKNHAYEREFEVGHIEKRAGRPSTSYPGIRYVLLHTFAHALIRQLAIECGYTSASITERIYSRNPIEGDPMAGVLIYTAASDSEGTLGGLSTLGEPEMLGRHIRRALEQLRLCASDPLCSEHPVGGGEKLHGAACHACAFLPETSCERSNTFLDRAALVPTVDREDLAFFR